MKQTTFTPTEARKQFFHVLRTVEKGERAFIVKKNSAAWFEIKLHTKKREEEKLTSLKKLVSAEFGTTDWETMKKTINTRCECSHD